MGKNSLDVLEAFRPYAPYKPPTVWMKTEADYMAHVADMDRVLVFANNEIASLKLDNARLRIRVGDLEDACKVARRALRRVRLLAMGMVEHRLQVTHVDRERGVVTCGPVNVDGDGREVA